MIITKFMLFKVTLILGSFLLAYVYYIGHKKGYKWVHRLIYLFIAIYAATQILLVIYFFSNHLNFPLNLEGLELIRLQHVRRVLQGLPIFVEPTPEYIPLVYQPIYYYLTMPLVWLFGDKLSTLRLFSILGTVGAGFVMFLIVRENAKSSWWGFIAVGLFAAAYRAMDSYFDVASSDTLLIFSVLLGCYLLSKEKSWISQFIGLIFLILSFWIKQHGAIFVIGALIYLAWRNGWRKTLPFAAVAVVLGPLLYYLVGPSLFGPKFLFFTQEVPRQWIEFSWNSTVIRVLAISANYVFLVIAAMVALIIQLKQDFRQIDLWYFLLPFAILSGFLAALVDPEGNNNVFIPMGVWFLLIGVSAIKYLVERIPQIKHWGLHIFMISISFVILIYNPKSELIPAQSDAQYQELVSTLKSLDGVVYSPYTGPLQDSFEFSPIANWILMYDLVRGPGAPEENLLEVKGLLEEVQHPNELTYILADRPIENDPVIGYLAEEYVLDTEFGIKFFDLKGLPMRYQVLFPKFLYRHITNR